MPLNEKKTSTVVFLFCVENFVCVCKPLPNYNHLTVRIIVINKMFKEGRLHWMTEREKKMHTNNLIWVSMSLV